MKDTLPSLTSTYRQEWERLKPLAAAIDIDKYYDLYEISHTDVQEAEAVSAVTLDADVDLDTLKALRSGLQHLHLIRKLYLCSLLALNSDAEGSNMSVWAVATESMSSLASKTLQSTEKIEKFLTEEECKSPC